MQKQAILFQNKMNVPLGNPMGGGLIAVSMCVLSATLRIKTEKTQKRSVGKLVVGVRG